LRLQPTLAQAHATLGKLLLEEGDRQAAADHFRDALRHDPNCVAALGPVAFFGVYPLSDTELSRIEALLAKPGLPAADASRLNFGLGSRSDRAGAHDNAFAYYVRANDLRRQVLRQEGAVFDAEKHRAWTQQFIAT